MPVDRPGPRYSLRSMACLLRIAPSSHRYHHAGIGVGKYAGLRARVARAFADSKGRYGYRRVKAALGTGVSENAVRRLMAEGGLSAHVPKRRRYSSYEGETTPAPGNLVNRDFTAERPNEKWLTDITEIKASDGKVYLSPMIDCHDGMVVAHTAGTSPNAEPARHDAGSGPPPRCGPASVPWSTVTAVVITGGRDGWNGWAGTAWSGP